MLMMRTYPLLLHPLHSAFPSPLGYPVPGSAGLERRKPRAFWHWSGHATCQPGRVSVRQHGSERCRKAAWDSPWQLEPVQQAEPQGATKQTSRYHYTPKTVLFDISSPGRAYDPNWTGLLVLLEGIFCVLVFQGQPWYIFKCSPHFQVILLSIKTKAPGSVAAWSPTEQSENQSKSQSEALTARQSKPYNLLASSSFSTARDGIFLPEVLSCAFCDNVHWSEKVNSFEAI